MAIPRLAESDTTRFGVFDVDRYDTNFFRLPDGVGPPDGSRRGGVTSVTGIGLSFDKAYGLQRIVLTASATHDHYPLRSDLDTYSERIDADYSWSVTPELSGHLIFDYARAPTSREYVGFQTEPNLQTIRTTRLEADIKAGSALHPRLSVYETTNVTEDPTFQLESSRSRGGEFSLVYQFASGNSVETYTRRGRGEDNNVPAINTQETDPNFSESESGLRLHAEIPGFYQTSIRVGYLDRKYSQVMKRDFSGIVGSVEGRVTLTGKTTLVASVTRGFSSSQTDFSSYSQDTYASVGVDWAATGKIVVRPSFNIRRQVFLGATSGTSETVKETTRFSSLQIAWTILRSLDVSAQVLTSSRSSTDPTLQFKDRSASVLARLKF